VNYTVSVDASFQEEWSVSGHITVQNTGSQETVITGIDDKVSGIVTPVALACPVVFPYALAAGETLTCDYSLTLPDGSDRVNTVTVLLDTGDELAATADIHFEAPVIVDDCVGVIDTYAGALGVVCSSDVPATFSYSRWVGPYDVCGDDSVDNVASFTASDSGATGSDSWSVSVDVTCPACTLAHGYWKTHSSHGPAPCDDTWAQLPNGADTPFYLSGQTYYEVLWTPARGKVYYILAKAYIAAALNLMNSAASTPEVNETLVWATEFFKNETPSSKLPKPQRSEAATAAMILDYYNNGLIGPGRCSEEDQDP